MGSTGASVLKILRNANAPIGVVTFRQAHRPFKRLLGSNAGGGKAGSGRGLGPIRARSPIPQLHGHGTSPMSPREPQPTQPKTLAMQSSRDMLEKLKREIDRLAGSIIRQEIVDHGLNAAMTAWHLTDWAWREIQSSTRLPTLTASAGAPIRDLKQFQELVKRNCAELAYCEGIAISTKHFAFSKLPVFSTKVTERFKIGQVPISKDGVATLHQFSPIGENITYTAQAAELWITDGRSLTPAAEVLENAYQWWRKFIDEVSHL